MAADKLGRHVSVNWKGATLYRIDIVPGGAWGSLAEPNASAIVFKAKSPAPSLH